MSTSAESIVLSWFNNKGAISENCVAEIGTIPEATIHFSPSQVSASEVSTGKVSTIYVSTSQVSTSKINTIGFDSGQSGLTQISFNEFSPLQNTAGQVTAGQVTAGQINFSQIGISENDSSKISLPSSITLQQLLSSHNSNLQNTTVPTWLEFLQGLSPFNLNIEIEDLPTGQLAEATITGFDPTGHPNAGTLYLDTDANGLGWFIDPTPWDNSEFAQTLTDTAYRATADSLTYGHYDLLTTILYETAHLQGFIAGYSNYDSRVQTLNGRKVFVGDNFSAILTPDGSHLSSQVYTYDLMNTLFNETSYL
jgi:hypothetical protein